MTPPVAKKDPFEITTHDHTRTDDYYWMRGKEKPEVIAHLEAENGYAKAKMAHTEALQAALYEEMVGRIQETDSSVPAKRGGFYYYSRTVEGLQYPIYCRAEGAPDADEQVTLDLNEIDKASDSDYLVLGVSTISPNQKILAYGLDQDGSETYVIRFKNLETGALLADTIEGVAGSAVWGDDQTIFYTTEDDAKRSDKLHRHTLGTAQSDDVMVFHEPDALYSVYPYKTNDDKYLGVISYGIEQHEAYYLDLADPTADLNLIQHREKGIRYDFEHRDGVFYIVTNADGASNSKVVTASASDPSRANWVDFVPHRPDVKLYGIDVFQNYIVRYERVEGIKQIVIMNLADGSEHQIEMHEPVYTTSGGTNLEFETDVLRFGYTSLTTPSSVYDYNMATKELTLMKQQPVLGGYDAESYVTDRIMATAEDGKQIPMSVVYKKGSWQGKPTNLHLYGYGSYGATIDPGFSLNRISLLDRGLVFVIAHVRGSQMLGREWYEDGKFLNKKNTFTDFIDCAKHLISAGYTTPDMMTMEGRSAGGLLMGAVLNMAPDLFMGAIAGVPFVDVITTMLDESIPLTVGEFDEWGNPKDPDYYDYMLSYSPYDNLEAKAYPHILVTAGLNDPRVAYWEPAKWVAKLRELKTDDNKLYMKMFMGAGHFSSSGRYDYLKDIAFEYAFLLDIHELA